LVMPTTGPAWRTDERGEWGEEYDSPSLPAIAGYPHLTVPMGSIEGLPVGISFIGAAWSEAQLLSLGAAYERATQRRQAPAYAPSSAATAAPDRDLLAVPPDPAGAPQ
jgi:amidase